MRELMEKMPRYFDVSAAKGSASLGARSQALAHVWRSQAQKSECFADGKWGGQIDPKLRKALRNIAKFVDDFEVEHPRRRQNTSHLLRSMDPMKAALPKAIQDLRITEWEKCREYFVGISHHNPNVTETDFSAWMDAAVTFLLNQLAPRTFEDQATLDEIIAEGEKSA